MLAPHFAGVERAVEGRLDFAERISAAWNRMSATRGMVHVGVAVKGRRGVFPVLIRVREGKPVTSAVRALYVNLTAPTNFQ